MDGNHRNENDIATSLRKLRLHLMQFRPLPELKRELGDLRRLHSHELAAALKAMPVERKAMRTVERLTECTPERLRFLRETSGMSADDFASRLHVSRGKVSAWENGRSPIPPEAVELAERLYDDTRAHARTFIHQTSELQRHPVLLREDDVPDFTCDAIVLVLFPDQDSYNQIIGGMRQLDRNSLRTDGKSERPTWHARTWRSRVCTDIHDYRLHNAAVRMAAILADGECDTWRAPYEPGPAIAYRTRVLIRTYDPVKRR